MQLNKYVFIEKSHKNFRASVDARDEDEAIIMLACTGFRLDEFFLDEIKFLELPRYNLQSKKWS